MDDEDDDTEDDSFGYEGEEVVSVGVSGGDVATEDDLNEACSDLDLECEPSAAIRHNATEVFQRCQVAAIQIGYHNKEEEEEEEDQLRNCIATQKVRDEREREMETKLSPFAYAKFCAFVSYLFYFVFLFLLFLLRIVVCIVVS